MTPQLAGTSQHPTTSPRRTYVDIGRRQMHLRYRTGAASAIPLVLVHQIASSSLMFEQFMANAPEHLSLIAIDLPGFGCSDPLEDTATIARWATALEETLDVLYIEQFDLFGHHAGAAVAIALAATAGERVGRLVLSGPPRYDADTRPLMESFFESLHPTDGSDVVEATHRFLASIAGERGAPAVSREVALTLLSNEQLGSYRSLIGIDLDALIAKIHQPTLVMVGEHDLLAPAAGVVHSMIAGSEFRVIPDAGIYIFDEQPARAGAIVIDFVTR